MEQETFDKIYNQVVKSDSINIYTANGLNEIPTNYFINTDADSILYNLNRIESVVLTQAKPDKSLRWVNDYAVAKVIRALKTELDGKTKYIELLQKQYNEVVTDRDFVKEASTKLQEQFNNLKEEYIIEKECLDNLENLTVKNVIKEKTPQYSEQNLPGLHNFLSI